MTAPGSKREIYDNARVRWPPTFRIIRGRSNANVVITDPSDFDTYRDIEKSIGPNDEWSQLSAWAFYQALGKEIRKSYEEGQLLVLTRNVPFGIFETQMKSNLADESWRDERIIYENLL
ncbi:MAG: hypothetical protein H0X36_13340 [Sphingomonadaceae bacterium]|nr:hypothetical protein [Sphingomonadaceae bacterium]